VNRYKNGKDNIAFHHDRETDWKKGSGFATIAFGAERIIKFRSLSGVTKEFKHKHGELLHAMPPTNTYWKHAIPCVIDLDDERISLTLRWID
jgi:alkylated DNA repair dioxygenase AlkB